MEEWGDFIDISGVCILEVRFFDLVNNWFLVEYGWPFFILLLKEDVSSGFILIWIEASSRVLSFLLVLFFKFIFFTGSELMLSMDSP